MLMLNDVLAGFYGRDLRKLIEEVNLFKSEDDLWRIQGTVKNPAGNLVLHLIGGLNHLIGATLAKSGYIRNRDEEFTRKGVKREELTSGLEELILLINRTINNLTPEQMEKEFPIFFDKPHTSVSYVLIQLLAHLNYHLGQVNYIRRVLE
ncbi:DinB family protein [Mucilaginibacter sp. 22184]|uniref:DinB family protein n=1 Tax=Mucilaginibacter sp. 22184 TaxID=3453887 RepID=UPI003F87D092